MDAQPGTIIVAPLRAVKSVAIQMTPQRTGPVMNSSLSACQSSV